MPSAKLQMKNKEKAPPGFSVGVILNRKPVRGEIGIEIEVEGKNLPGVTAPAAPAPWTYHTDHSLRGAENGEYVLAKPIMFTQVPKALKELWNCFEKNKSVLDISNRTSVHVHLNMQDFHLNRLATFFAAWFSIEEVLTEFCGEHRVGNLFCLRAVDAPAVVSYIKKFIRSDGEYPLSDPLRYAALNPAALGKYGSVEIRTLRGCTKPEEIQLWVDILERLYRLSEKYKDPREFVAQFSSGGPQSFFDTLLGDMAPVVREGLTWSQQELNTSLFRGIRYAQDICFCRDWSQYNPVALKNDPFGRDTKKIAKKLMDQPVQGTAGPVSWMQFVPSTSADPLELPDFEPDYDD